MISFFIGTLFGTALGVFIMALFVAKNDRR